MKANMKELTINEMERIAAGGAVNSSAKKKFWRKLLDWIFG